MAGYVNVARCRFVSSVGGCVDLGGQQFFVVSTPPPHLFPLIAAFPSTSGIPSSSSTSSSSSSSSLSRSSSYTFLFLFPLPSSSIILEADEEDSVYDIEPGVTDGFSSSPPADNRLAVLGEGGNITSRADKA
jgi:hypothetical protein